MFGAVGMVTKERQEGWDIETTSFYGPNVMIYEIFNGIQRTNLIRAYLSPSNMDHLPDLEETLNHFLGRDIIIMGT